MKRGKLAGSLAAATCSLLGAASGRTVAQEAPRRWSFDTALLYYGEQDGRVSDFSASVFVERLFSSERRLSLKLTADTLTGASPSGAVPSHTPQTFTSPSGAGSYTTPAGKTPLDPTFLDTRFALATDFEHGIGQRSRLAYGLSASNEYDYFHLGAHGTYSRNFGEHKNTTLDVALAYSSDSIDPVGGAPVPLAAMLPVNQTGNKLGDDSKTVADLVLGVTHVLGKRTVGQLNYSISKSDGYLTDPYKVISVVDPISGDPVPATGGLNLVLYETRPDGRLEHALFARVKHHLQRDVLDGSYRFATDDWGITSHTLDLHYRFIRRRFYLQPHLRYYRQSAADFYVPYLVSGQSLPHVASADYRLGEFDAVTLGLKFGMPVGKDHEWSVRIEYYSQSGTSPPGAELGSLASFDLVPSLGALIVQGGYRF